MQVAPFPKENVQQKCSNIITVSALVQFVWDMVQSIIRFLNLNISTVIFVSLLTLSYLLIGLWNEAGDAAVSIQKLLKLLVTDDEPLRLPQGFFSCIFTIDQQTLEDLNTGSADGERVSKRVKILMYKKHTHSASLLLPSSGRGQAG